jgi:type I restriction-modification system DNA methylase subunit
MSDNDEMNQYIIMIKELFMKNISNRKELSRLIDEYFVPHESERKNNAEIPTPYELRQEMLNIISVDFWNSPKRIFEPCCGKGGFLIDIIDRFMIGLSPIIPDESIRYKIIVEECIYFSDISSINIFICKLLIDPCNKYSLNFNIGNTLDLNIEEKWGIQRFHGVIGNPPYENIEGSGDNKMYLEFIKSSFEKWLLQDAYLLFITPTNIKNYITNIDKNRKYISNFYEIKHLSLNTANKYFKNVGGVIFVQKTIA